MSKIRLLAILPFLAIATVANAGTTISDSNAALNSRVEAGVTVGRRSAGQDRNEGLNVDTYRGGPKIGTWSR